MHEASAVDASLNRWVLPATLLAFLFVGFVKGLFEAPVDLTLVAAALMCAATLRYLSDIRFLANPSFVTMEALMAWMLVSLALLPVIPQWGLMKAGEMVLFGAPAYFAGHIIARRPELQQALMKILAWSGVPISALLVLQAATGNPYSFSYLGSGGYQLTGIFLALAFVSASILQRPLIFAINVLGCSVTGHISGPIFGGLIVVGVWLSRSNWREITKEVSYSIGVLASYTLIVAPPLILMRALWKMGGAILVFAGQPVTPEQASAALTRTAIGETINHALKIMPEQSQNYLVEYTSGDRLTLFRQAWETFVANPYLGAGFGNVSYQGIQYPHNIFLEVASETGAIGVALLTILIVLSIANIVRSRNPMIISFFFLILLSYLFSGHFGARLLMFALGLAGAAYGIGAQKPAPPPAPSDWTIVRSLLFDRFRSWASKPPLETARAARAHALTFALAVIGAYATLEATRIHFYAPPQQINSWETFRIESNYSRSILVDAISDFGKKYNYKYIVNNLYTDVNELHGRYSFTYRDNSTSILTAWMKNDGELKIFRDRMELEPGISISHVRRPKHEMTHSYPWDSSLSLYMSIALGIFFNSTSFSSRLRKKISNLKVRTISHA